MNPIVFAMWRPITTLMLAVALASAGVLGLATTQPHQEHHRIVVTSPKATEVIITQQYDCQVHGSDISTSVPCKMGISRRSQSRGARR